MWDLVHHKIYFLISMILISIHIKIHGKVQGVFYRAETKKKADSLHITGWVKNMSDGTVEALFEGDEDNINQLLDWCKQGPEMAKVEKIEILQQRTITGNPYPSFNIEY